MTTRRRGCSEAHARLVLPHGKVCRNRHTRSVPRGLGEDYYRAEHTVPVSSGHFGKHQCHGRALTSWVPCKGYRSAVAQFTPKVRRRLSDYLTDVVLREIDALFEDNGVKLGPPQPDSHDPSERRERGRRHLATLDLNNPSDHAKLVAVYSDLMQEIGQQKEGGAYYDLAPLRAKWKNTLETAGFKVDPWSFVVTDPARPPSLGFAADALAALSDPSAILDHLARLGDTVESDPRLAVSTAKALIESTAKCVLSARGVTYTKADKVPALVNRAQESLGLAAKAASAEDGSLRRVLQSLVTLAQNVTEIRNQVGVDHGAESVPTWLRPRHARLVVGAAQVWCQLMLETLGDPSAPWRAGDVEGRIH